MNLVVVVVVVVVVAGRADGSCETWREVLLLAILIVCPKDYFSFDNSWRHFLLSLPRDI